MYSLQFNTDSYDVLNSFWHRTPKPKPTTIEGFRKKLNVESYHIVKISSGVDYFEYSRLHVWDLMERDDNIIVLSDIKSDSTNEFLQQKAELITKQALDLGKETKKEVGIAFFNPTVKKGGPAVGSNGYYFEADGSTPIFCKESKRVTFQETQAAITEDVVKHLQYARDTEATLNGAIQRFLLTQGHETKVPPHITVERPQRYIPLPHGIC